MKRRRNPREPLLALAGVVLAFAGAGAGVFAIDRFRDDSAELVAFPIQQDTTAGATPGQRTPTAAAATATTAASSATTAPSQAGTAPASATPTPAVGALALQQASFALPGDATANNGGTIGPFCCRGSTVTVRSASGDVLGYAYWFKWQGQAYDLPRDGRYIGIFPDIQFLVNDTAGADAVISLSASEITPGASRTVQAGRLSFTLRFTAAEQTTYNGVIYVVEGSLAATLQVEAK
ncbi:MAG: hypothetical protein AB7H85_08485 [Dehalococcoidia bacterium]